MDFQNLQSLNQIIPEEETQGEELYKTWKKNVPLLYDTMITHVMDWPSLTTQFLPIENVDSDGLFTTYKMLLGTHTTNNMPNYLMVAKVISNKNCLIKLFDKAKLIILNIFQIIFSKKSHFAIHN